MAYLTKEQRKIVGTQPPKGYLPWHHWAEVQQKAGLRQRQCPVCNLWRFPQEKCCKQKKRLERNAWRCLRCRAGQEWISRNRAKCLRCGAGREWLERGKK